jgi:hypothetical protein
MRLHQGPEHTATAELGLQSLPKLGKIGTDAEAVAIELLHE